MKLAPHGRGTIFVARFVPVVRHLISIPAGVGSMNLAKFCIFTLIGGTIWNTILLFAGIKLGNNWEIIHHYSHEVDYVFIAGILVVGGWWVRKRRLVARGRAGFFYHRTPAQVNPAEDL